MAVATAGLRKSFSSGNWFSGSGMIQPFEANSAVQMTSMSMTSYSSLLAWRFATSWASWSLEASGSRSGVTFCCGYFLFQPAITPVSQPMSSLPMAKVIGPIPFVDGTELAGAEPADEHPASMRAAATSAIPVIARRMEATIPPTLGKIRTCMLCTAVRYMSTESHNESDMFRGWPVDNPEPTGRRHGGGTEADTGGART